MEQTVGENRRFCKKCLTRDMIGQEAYFQSLQDYVAGLDPDTKVDKASYEERLAVCVECELLFQGMCRTCGCYVELRAALRKNACPNHHWEALI